VFQGRLLPKLALIGLERKRLHRYVVGVLKVIEHIGTVGRDKAEDSSWEFGIADARPYLI
jgi:hypothetical protein